MYITSFQRSFLKRFRALKMTELTLKREIFEEYTKGSLYLGREFLCDTLEDKVREVKIMHQTAIPAGRYEVIVTMSPKFRRELPRIVDVPGFTGILIHAGNSINDTSGCILVGNYWAPGLLADSRKAEKKITGLIKSRSRYGQVFITIENA